MELNKLCRTCLSATEDMKSLYETCATSTQICCAEILSSFTPLICCKDDGLPTMICHNCIREITRFHTFRLKCLESDGVLRKHVVKVSGVAGTNITVTNQLRELHNQNSIKLEEDMDEDSRIFEEVSIKNEFPTSSKKEISATSLNDPLSITEMQEDVLDIVKHEVDIKIEEDEHVNNALDNKQESEKPYPCTVCNRSYKQKTKLKIHMRSHTGERPYSCTVCSSSFRIRHQLPIHMRTHTGEKPYSCTLCNSSFTKRNYLTLHMRTHTGERPYSCTVCDSSFTQPYNLTMHMRTHTGERPYSCTVCDMSFGHPHNLKMHLRTHSGEQPFSCTICNSSFKSKRSLTIHKRTHTRDTS